jgi:acyl dehydratase
VTAFLTRAGATPGGCLDETVTTKGSPHMWRDLTDPRQVAEGIDLEEGRREPVFENLSIPEPFGPVRLVVDDHKIKRFAFTQDDYGDWYLCDSPFGGRIGQAGLLTNDLVQLFTTEFAASRTVGLHTEEQLWFESPVRLGEQVTLEGEYVEAYERRGQGYVVMEARATGADGRTLVRHRGVEILRTVPGSVAGRGATSAGSTEGRVSDEVAPDAPVAETVTPDLAVGTMLSPLHKTITQEQASVFSRAGEYVRNIHSDLDIARRAQLRIPIIQGQQQCCLVTELLTRFVGAAWFTTGWLRVKFVQPVEVFEPLEVSGRVVGVTPLDGGGRRIDLETWVKRADGRLSTVGWARADLPPDGGGPTGAAHPA